MNPGCLDPLSRRVRVREVLQVRAGGAILSCGFAVLALAVVSSASGAGTRPGNAREVRVKQIVADLRHGGFSGNGVVVDKRLVLSNETIDTPFRCRKCVFAGGIDASDTVFRRSVDLAGSRFERAAVFRGAAFEAPAVFGRTTRQVENEKPFAGFKRGADFSLAVFHDLASFNHARFKNNAAFEETQFRGRTDFASAIFHPPVSFRAADFSQRTTFTQARFSNTATFDASAFAKGASFLAGTFTGNAKRTAASFDGVASGGDIDFTFVNFVGKTTTSCVSSDNCPDTADLSFLVCTASVDFSDATFSGSIAMDKVHVADLVLDDDLASQIDSMDSQINVLKLIESSAKNHGALGKANDAHYRLELLTSKTYGQPWHALDDVFYRGVAGYLVRPLRPLLILCALVVLLALARTLRGGHQQLGRAPAAISDRGVHPWRKIQELGRRFLTDVLDAFAEVVPRRGRAAADVSLGRRLAILACRVLVVCALVALANANPTLRQMVDSLT
jgi:hypothetical protein